MHRILVASLAFAAVGIGIGIGIEPIAWAHGGQYVNPGGAVPPGLQPPSDPTPPPPPPPSITPPDQPPTTGGSSAPTPPPGATKPPSGPPTTGMPDGGPARPKTPTVSGDHWTFWWAFNNADILHLKDEIYRMRASPGSPLGQVGGAVGNRSDATRMTERRVKEDVIPALLATMDPSKRTHPDMRSAAFLALAKVTTDPAHLPLLLAGVHGKDGLPNTTDAQIVRESAALAIGLLRRSDPDRRLDAKDLDRARDGAFAIFEDGRLATRTRAFAMFSVGLLGDQPTTRGSATTTGEGLASTFVTTTDRIVGLLDAPYAQDDLPISLLVALSLQPPTSVRPEILEALKDAMLKGRFGKARVSDLVASYAALALGRIGTPEYARALLLAVRSRGVSLDVQRSAAIALGRIGARADGAARVEIALGLLDACQTAKDSTARNFAVMSLADLVCADARAHRSDVLDAKRLAVADFLVHLTEAGNYAQRPFGALASGLVCRAIGDTPDLGALSDLRIRLVDALRAGLDDTKVDARSRGAFAIGLGLAHDGPSRGRLVALVSDGRQDSELRGYAAVGLGLVGDPSPEMVRAVERVFSGRPTEELRVQCAVALGLLGAPNAVDVLVKELDGATSENVQGQVVLALGKIGDARALPPLLAMLRDELRPDLTRAMACAGLGLVGDLEPVASLSRLSTGLNYRAGCDAIQEVLTIL